MTILSSVTGFFTGKLRLYLEYLLIALLMMVLGWATYQYIHGLKLDNTVTKLSSDLATSAQRVDAVEKVNAQQQEAINTIKGVREVDSTMLQGLAKDMETLRVKDTSMKNRLGTLEKSNEAVRKYLNTAIPAPVGCLLDHTCPATDGDTDGTPASAATVAPAVQSASSGPVKQQR